MINIWLTTTLVCEWTSWVDYHLGVVRPRVWIIGYPLSQNYVCLGRPHIMCWLAWMKAPYCALTSLDVGLLIDNSLNWLGKPNNFNYFDCMQTFLMLILHCGGGVTIDSVPSAIYDTILRKWTSDVHHFYLLKWLICKWLDHVILVMISLNYIGVFETNYDVQLSKNHSPRPP